MNKDITTTFLNMTRPVLYILLSCVLKLSQMFPTMVKLIEIQERVRFILLLVGGIISPLYL